MSVNVKRIIMSLIMASALTSCGNRLQEETSEISISSCGKEIAFISEEFYPSDEENSASEFVSAESWLEQAGEPEYYPDGSLFEIKFPEDMGIPDSVSINDVLITSDGKLKYDKSVAVKEAVPVINDNTVSFVLDKHLATSLSSNSEDYKKGSAYRSFGIICGWGDEQYRYTFCIRSDPDHIME